MPATTAAVVVALAVLLGARLAAGAPLTVVNPSFETPSTPPGTFIVNAAPTGWTTFGSVDFSGRVVGVVNPNSTTLYADPVPDGANVAVTFFLPSFTNNPAGLQQVLGDTLQANTAYTLTVAVGNMAVDATPPHNAFNFNGFPGYRVDLLAGSTVLASDNNSLLPGEGRFLTSTVQFSSGASHPNLSQALAIRLVNLDAAPGIEVNFDQVQLDAVPVPTATPTNTPTGTPTDTPTAVPTVTATAIPTATPTATPPVSGCPLVLPTECKSPVPQRGSLALAFSAGSPDKSRAKWSWIGAATSIAELGDPLTTSSYRLCIYDGAGSVLVDSLATGGAVCDGEPCWRVGSNAIRYRDRAGLAAGLTSLKIKTGEDGRAKVQAKSQGALLTLPGLPLLVAPDPVVVLLVNEEIGTCWLSRFSVPLTDAGNDRSWKARND